MRTEYPNTYKGGFDAAADLYKPKVAEREERIAFLENEVELLKHELEFERNRK